MKEFKVLTETTSEVFARVRRFIRPGKKYRLVLTEFKKRSMDANSQMHVWCKIISQDTGEDIKTVTLRNKMDLGLPILLASGSEQASVVSYILERANYQRMDELQRMKVIGVLEITRTFTTAEHNELRDNMQAYWRDQGIELPYMS